MRKYWGTRTLVATDSRASLGVVQKGRSSAYPLLRQARMLAAMSLGLRVKVYARYLESERNPADGPSRLKAIGAAEETKRAHMDRILKRLQK